MELRPELIIEVLERIPGLETVEADDDSEDELYTKVKFSYLDGYWQQTAELLFGVLLPALPEDIREVLYFGVLADDPACAVGQVYVFTDREEDLARALDRVVTAQERLLESMRSERARVVQALGRVRGK
jgi:hypothetical protein